MSETFPAYSDDNPLYGKEGSTPSELTDAVPASDAPNNCEDNTERPGESAMAASATVNETTSPTTVSLKELKEYYDYRDKVLKELEEAEREADRRDKKAVDISAYAVIVNPAVSAPYLYRDGNGGYLP